MTTNEELVRAHDALRETQNQLVRHVNKLHHMLLALRISLEHLDTPDELATTVVEVVKETMATSHSEPGAWRKQPINEHVDHAMLHLVRWDRRTPSEPHLAHAITRLAMALVLIAEEE